MISKVVLFMEPLIQLLPFALSIPLGRVVAKHFSEKSDSWSGVWTRGALISAALAAFGFFTSGQPLCQESDPLSGSCISFSDSGRQWTSDKATDDAWNIFWKTCAGGTVGMVLLRRELHKKGSILFLTQQQIGGRAQELLQDSAKLRHFLSAMTDAVASGLNYNSQEFRRDFVHCDLIAREVLRQARNISNYEKHQEIMHCFYEASRFVHDIKEILPSTLIAGTVFDGLKSPSPLNDNSDDAS